MKTSISGFVYVNGTSARYLAELIILDSQFELRCPEIDQVQTGDLKEINISPRLGDIERKILIGEDTVFGTADNDLVDKLLRANNVSNWVHILESNLIVVSMALLVSISLLFSFFKWGVPWVSHEIAHSLPQSIAEDVGKNSLAFLDMHTFSETKLSQQRQDHILKHFKGTLLANTQSISSVNYTLNFRAWNQANRSIENALALPSGDIILSDAFIQLSQNQDEIDSVILHEIGHIEKRHTLKMLVQETIFSSLFTYVINDSSLTADLGVTLASELINSSHSRINESEADEYAFHRMLNEGIDPAAFNSILSRISNNSENNQDQKPSVTTRLEAPTEISSQTDGDGPSATESEKGWLDYLSSHPNPEQRTQRGELYASCFKLGLKSCENSMSND